MTESSLFELQLPQPSSGDLASRFFSSAIRHGHLAHAYILKGKNTAQLYQMALDVAKALNCAQPVTPQSNALRDPDSLQALACGECTDCKWIAKNSHPAVLTVSPLTYLVNDKGELMGEEELEKHAKKGTVSTQIKTDQMGRLIQQLGISSPKNRVIIFTHAEVLPASMVASVPAPLDWQTVEANQDKSFHPRALDASIFNVFSVNKFLKTLEEPPPRVVFFFLVETEAQLLDTIVSRCQVIPCALSGGMPQELSSGLLSQDHLRTGLNALASVQDVYEKKRLFEQCFIEEGGLTTLQVLTALQEAFRTWFISKKASLSPINFQAYREWQQETKLAIDRLEAKAHADQTLYTWLMALDFAAIKALANPNA